MATEYLRYRQLRLSFPYGGEPAYCPNRLGNQLSGQRNPESGTAPSGNRLPEVRNSSRSGISCSRCRGGCSSSGQIRHERLLPTGRPLLSSVQAVWKYCRSSSGCRRRFDFLRIVPPAPQLCCSGTEFIVIVDSGDSGIALLAIEAIVSDQFIHFFLIPDEACLQVPARHPRPFCQT